MDASASTDEPRFRPVPERPGVVAWGETEPHAYTFPTPNEKGVWFVYSVDGATPGCPLCVGQGDIYYGVMGSPCVYLLGSGDRLPHDQVLGEFASREQAMARWEELRSHPETTG